MSDITLQMEHISKKFGGVIALHDVSLELRRGEVLCLVGENGAGKSTLMKILSGVFRPDEGSIYLQGQKTTIHNPTDAYRYGISIVHQELLQIPQMSVEENIYVGRYEKKCGFLDYKKLR